MHPKQEELEKKLSDLCQALDNHLEDKYGEHYKIHPNRLKRGKGANPSFDGLFSTSLAFTLGYGSKYGRGYVMNVEIRSYLPLVLWQNGRDPDAMRIWMKMTDPGYHRREYPEVSYAALEGLVFGYMGVQCDAESGTVTTQPALSEHAWAQVTGLPLWGGQIDLRHEGRHHSRITNRTDRTIEWSACGEKGAVRMSVLPGQSAET